MFSLTCWKIFQTHQNKKVVNEKLNFFEKKKKTKKES